MTLPNFIGIGAPKAGTTWLFKCLQQHPDIYMAPVKETNFFDYSDPIDHRLAEYESHFFGANGHSAIGELSTRYLDSRWGAPERIHTHLPHVKLFVSLRNPIDQVYSHYWHLHRQGFHQSGRFDTSLTFREAVRLYANQLLRPAYYAQHLDRWLRLFDRRQMHVIFYDDILAHPGSVVRNLYSFLGVDADFVPASLLERGSSVRRGTSPRGPVLESFHRSAFELMNRWCYTPLKAVIGPRRAVRLKDQLRVRQLFELAFFRRGYPPMDASSRAILVDLFRKEIARLSTLTGRELRHWIELSEFDLRIP